MSTHDQDRGSSRLPAAQARLALSATLHCLTGCSIGEVLGMVAGSASGWGNATTVAVSVALAFVFGYALTLLTLRRGGLLWGPALRLALASDTLSIAVMEVVDNALMLSIPGAMDAPISSLLFWASLVLALGLAGLAAFPTNLWLIRRGWGHARVHERHAAHPGGAGHRC
jgi:hypothetical protein